LFLRLELTYEFEKILRNRLLCDAVIHGSHALADELRREPRKLGNGRVLGVVLGLALRFRTVAVCPLAILGRFEAVLHDREWPMKISRGPD